MLHFLIQRSHSCCSYMVSYGPLWHYMAFVHSFFLKRQIQQQVGFFDETLKRFQRYLEAGIERSKSSIEITFRDPNQKLRKIYCDPPHGSQLRKAWPAWRHHMIKGLEAAGFEF